MFSFDQADEQCQISFIFCQEGKLQLASSVEGSELSNKLDYSRGRNSSISSLDKDNPNDNKKKNIIHRDIERQRRQEMATLYESLRSLLPLEYLKHYCGDGFRGKLSISDQMHEAVNYIKDLKNKIQELSDKRDELKRLSNSYARPFAPECSRSCPQDCVMVKPCWRGVEVVINTALRQGFPLSKMLEGVIAEGLNIVNCISTNVNERLLLTIESEVSDGKRIDIPELQQKLTNLMICSSS